MVSRFFLHSGELVNGARGRIFLCISSLSVGFDLTVRLIGAFLIAG